MLKICFKRYRYNIILHDCAVRNCHMKTFSLNTVQGVPLPFDPPGQPKLQGVFVLFVYCYKYIASKVTNLKFYAIRSIINISSLCFLNCG